MHTFKCLKTIEIFLEKDVTTLKFIIFYDDPIILVGCASFKIKMVDFLSNETIMDIPMKIGYTREILYIPEKSLLMGTCWDKNISCWKIKKTEEKDFDRYFKKVETMVDSKNQKFLFCVHDGSLFYLKL